MTRTILPGARAPLVGSGGLTEPPFYHWMQQTTLGANNSSDAIDQSKEDIVSIAKALGSPDGSVSGIPKQGIAGIINGGGSINVDGTLESGVVTITLQYDTQNPGATAYYGSGPDGARGWFPVSSALASSASIDVLPDATTGVSTFDLRPTGVTPGTFGAGTKFLIVSVGQDGRIDGLSEYPLIAGNGISFDINPDTGAVTISVNSFVANNRVTRDGATRVTRNGDIRITR